jgi:hypothetical protein
LGKRVQLRQINRDLGERLASCSAGERSTTARVLAKADSALPPKISKVHALVKAPDVDLLRRKGCVDLGQIMSADQADDIRKYLATKPLLIGRAAHRAEGPVSSLENVPRDKNYACYSWLDLWSSAHLVDFATQDRLLDLAEGYLGCTPTLYSLNAFWGLPERQADPEVQAFHRDLDDFGSVVVFVQLTPVDAPEEGALSYVEGSHDIPMLEASLRADGLGTKVDYLVTGPFVAPMSMRLFHRSARRFYGPAGATICADAYGLHRSAVPRSRPQLLLEVRFGTFFNERMFDMSLNRDGWLGRILRRAMAPLLRVRAFFDQTRREQVRQILQRIPATPRHRYVFRYMIDALSAEL